MGLSHNEFNLQPGSFGDQVSSAGPNAGGGSGLLGRIGKLIRFRSTTTLLALLAILTTGAGAATGTVLRGDVQGAIPITVSQALVVQKPDPIDFPTGRKFFSSTSDDSTRFSVALELYRGDSLTVLVPIVNRSSGDAVSEFSVVMPEIPSLVEGVLGVSLEAVGSGLIDDLVQVTRDSWTFTADAGASGVEAGPTDGLLITFNVSNTAMAGFFEIDGRVRTLEF